MSRKELMFLSFLRRDARENITDISKAVEMPVSTLFDKLNRYQNNFIKKHTTLLDFDKLGFKTRAEIAIKVGRGSRDAFVKFLNAHRNVNSVRKVNTSFDFLVEAIFPNINQLDDFVLQIEEKFEVLDKKIYHVIEDIKDEDFMADPKSINVLLDNADVKPNTY